MEDDDRRASWLFSAIVIATVAIYVILNWDAVVPEVGNLFSAWLK